MKKEGAVVRNLYFRPNKSQPPTDSTELNFIIGNGVANDCHAHPLSPRQVLIATSSAYRDFNLPSNTLRENILLLPDADFRAEQLESGDMLSLDHSEFKLRITFQCEPCGRLNKTRPNLCGDIKGQRGWLARVVNGGVLRINDRLHVTKGMYPQFSEDWRDRVITVARLLPENRSLSYTRLALLAGVASAYCRAFPRLLSAHRLPTERIVPSSLSPAPLPEWNGQEVFNPERL